MSIFSDVVPSTRMLPPVTEETDADDEGDDVTNEMQVAGQPEVETTTMISQSATFHPYTAATLPFITNEEYLTLVGALIKILASENTLQEWITKDFAHHQVGRPVMRMWLTRRRCTVVRL